MLFETQNARVQAVKGQTLLKKVKPLRPDQRCVVLLPVSR